VLNRRVTTPLISEEPVFADELEEIRRMMYALMRQLKTDL